MGIFDLTGRYTLFKAADSISELRANGYLNEHCALYQSVKKEHSDLFDELIYKRGEIDIYLKLGADEELTQIKTEWFSNNDGITRSIRVRELIDNISEANQQMLDYLPDIERRWFRTDNVDFEGCSFEHLKDYCMYSSIRAIPRKYLKQIYEHPQYKSTVEFPVNISHLHTLWDQINCKLANYNIKKII